MDIQKPEKPELLAPAGNLNCAVAALHAGADAVYAGISRFNAREMGENFSWDDMSRLSAYTKKLNKKFFLTLNTLVKEHELVEFGSSVEKIAALKPDAVIIQDLGVLRFLREYFPQLELHASTQMGIHNSAGVLTAAEAGIKRVILERQVTTEELRTICRLPVEIEVFVHGALCCSISGHCLFSSWQGGWSGNRGRCKQPCRRRFHGEEHGAKKSGFFFSTMDYYSLDMLDVLEEAGVCSLKIEGRLKKPDYVKNVVTAYRMMLDADSQHRPSVIKEARAVLSGSYGRKWSHGFSSPEDMENLIQFKSTGVSGRLAGTVGKTAPNGFEAEVSQRLHTGDRIRIQPRSGDEGPSITITRMSAGREQVKTAPRGSRVFIHCDKEVAVRSMIYKIGESSSDSVKKIENLPLYDPPLEIDLDIRASRNGLRVRALLPGGSELEWSDPEPVDQARKSPLSAEDLHQAFTVTRNPLLDAGSISVTIDAGDSADGLFIPAGRLKKSRRSFWEWLEQSEELISAESGRGENAAPPWKKAFEAERNSFSRTEAGPAAAFSPVPVRGTTLPAETIRVYDLHSFLHGPSRSADGPGGIAEIILPFFCPENRLGQLEKDITEAAARGIRRFRITSLYQFRLLGDALADYPAAGTGSPEGFRFTASFPLPAANSMAAMELRRLGAERVQIWLELEREAAEQAAAAWPAEAEVYRTGKPFLLATRAVLSIDGRITDSRGKEFSVVRPVARELDYSEPGQPGGLGYVFPSEVLEHPGIEGCADYFELVRVTGGEEKTGFNYDFSLI